MTTSYDMPMSAPPAELSELRDLALDLRWSWSHAADKLWQRIDPDTWDRTHNPWLILQTVSRKYLLQLASDTDFISLLSELRREQNITNERPAWFQQNHLKSAASSIAYFSMEFGLDESLPIYSGGLGVLAADYLKAGSELGLPIVGIGLLYQQGYFRQGLDAEGNQLVFFPYNDPTQLPIQPVRDLEGEWLLVEVDLPGRILRRRIWQVIVGRVTLYLMDSNDSLNSPADRGITSELYGGGPEMRLQQEIVLGIGGYRLLQSLQITPVICHLNEGHAAFVVLEQKSDDKNIYFTIQVYLNDLEPESVQVELCADAGEDYKAEVYLMKKSEPLVGAVHGYLYTVAITALRPATDYTVRVVPFHPQATIPLEANQILWEH